MESGHWVAKDWPWKSRFSEEEKPQGLGQEILGIDEIQQRLGMVENIQPWFGW